MKQRCNKTWNAERGTRNFRTGPSSWRLRLQGLFLSGFLRSALPAPRSALRAHSHPRRGSTLLVVMALLGMLAVLGFLFYTFAAQERSNAQYFAEAAKLNEEELGPEAYFDWALEQLIVGPDSRRKQSALWGGRHSLTANMYGRDLHPFTGEGVNVVNLGGTAAVEGDVLHPWLDFNDSPAAHDGTEVDLDSFPDPDVDYTYPDINNLFLAYKGVEPTTGKLIIIPSFHRPQYIRAYSTDWWTNPDTVGRVMRPHELHAAIGSGTPQSRFVMDAGAASAVGLSAPFPEPPDLQSPSGAPPNGVPGEQGIWDYATNQDAPYEYDVDNDVDGIRDGNWMDLDFPLQEDTATGRLFVPLMSFTILDANGLLDLNTHGNMPGMTIASADLPAGERYAANSDHAASQPFGLNRFVSRSNQGLSPAEVNPLWALNARPGQDYIGGSAATMFRQHELFFGEPPEDLSSYNLPGPAPSWRELANMEWFFLLAGRAEFRSTASVSDVGDLFHGRWGEPSRFYDELQRTGTRPPLGWIKHNFPLPGESLFDDNDNINEGEDPAEPAFVHPLDFAGLSFSVARNSMGLPSPNGKRPLLRGAGGTDPSRWIGYHNVSTTLGRVAWLAAAGGTLITPAGPEFVLNALLDDPMETIADREKSGKERDEVFGPDEIAFLHMTDADLENAGLTSRLQKLMPFSMASSADNDRAQGRWVQDPMMTGDWYWQSGIREKFTTSSWDVKQAAVPTFRAWELSADPDFVGPIFPPQFGAVEATRPYRSEDPFRPVLRKLIHIEQDNWDTDKLTHQFRLNVNRLLTDDSGHPLPVFPTDPTSPMPPYISLDYRPLTPHITDPTDAASITTLPVPGDADYPPLYPPANSRHQEWWARRDRQLMARDIYVLLYTLGGGLDGTDYGTLSTLPLGTAVTGQQDYRGGALGETRSRGLNHPRNALTYTTYQLREMAQFAVNMVDALDRDEIITKFEYDTNLSDGWNLNDDPYNNVGEDGAPLDDPVHPEDTDIRGVVWGVESQEFTFSEAIVIRSTGSTDHAASMWDEGGDDQYHVFIELRNASPFDAHLASPDSTTPASAIWRVVRDDNEDKVFNGFDNAFVFQEYFATNPVAPGEIFTIGTTSFEETGGFTTPSGKRPSDFRIDHDTAGGTFELIIPDVADPAPPTGSSSYLTELDLDLISQDDGRFELNSGDAKDFLSVNSGGADFNATQLFNLRLERRANPYLINVPVAENPWVTVDGMSTEITEFLLESGDDATAIQNTRLAELRSRERPEPFDGYAEDLNQETYPRGGTGVEQYRRNRIGRVNYSTTQIVPNGQFSYWQSHFDRDFASVGEVLSVPLYGPHQATTYGAQSMRSPYEQQKPNDIFVPSGDGGLERALTFGAKAMRPDLPDTTPARPNELQLDNRWYRLLEFMDVPTRTHHPDLGHALAVDRVSGKLNFNTLRFPEVLAALLDDWDIVDLRLTKDVDGSGALELAEPENGDGSLDPTEDLNGNAKHDPDENIRPGVSATKLFPPALMDWVEPMDRDWWRQFLLARDGFDPLNPTLILPGLPKANPGADDGSRPFRSLAHVPPAALADDVQEIVEHTILRRLPLDAGAESRRTLFELGTIEEHLGTDGVISVPMIDSHTKHRLLSKIYGNTTTRSNVFIVFMSVKFFEAVETADGAVLIGGPLNGTPPLREEPDHRGFFIIDRSRAPAAYDPSNQSWDWRELIEYRKTLQ